MADDIRCGLCGELFAACADRDRHDCKGLIGEPARREFWTPTVLYVVCGATLVLAYLLFPLVADIGPGAGWWLLSGVFSLVGALFLLTGSEAPVEEWLVRLNRFTEKLDDPRSRRRDALVSFAFALLSALAGLATQFGFLR